MRWWPLWVVAAIGFSGCQHGPTDTFAEPAQVGTTPMLLTTADLEPTRRGMYAPANGQARTNVVLNAEFCAELLQRAVDLKTVVSVKTAGVSDATIKQLLTPTP